MAYGKFTLRGVYSLNSDFSGGEKRDTGKQTITASSPTMIKADTIYINTTSLIVYDHSVEAWSNIDMLYVKTPSTADEEATITYDGGDANKTQVTVILPAGKTFFTDSVSPDDITITTGAGFSVDFWIVGS